uniref:Uncharacterized protein n=1 Tax=Musa acuminata subsp. malaccensis TaxID=214687 RepID=A0A804KLM7_MUSAM
MVLLTRILILDRCCCCDCCCCDNTSVPFILLKSAEC